MPHFIPQSELKFSGLFTATGLINDGSDRVVDIANDNSPLRRYTHGDNVDEPLLLQTFSGGSVAENYSYHTDHLGSVRYITDSAGQVVNAYDYDSYGRPYASVETVAQPYRYTGREWDDITGLYYYRARTYDASTGRFLQEDPIGFASGDLNIYRYVKNNPISYNDPYGLAAISSAALNRRGKKAAGKLGLGITPRLNCIFTLAGEALEVAMEQRIDSVDLNGCSITKKARIFRKKSNPKHGNSVTNPKRQFYVYVIYQGTEIKKVGQGKGDRAQRQLKGKERYIIIARSLTKSQALALECTIVMAAALSNIPLTKEKSQCYKKGKKLAGGN